jgi:universal stress protein E
MKLLKTILVAVDFDDALDPVLTAASALAKKFGSEVVLAHVVETGDQEGQELESLRKSMAARLGRLQHQLTVNGVTVSQVSCLHGKAFGEIRETAERIGASLIMLGARGAGTVHHFAMGTNTENAICYSPRPVLAVPLSPALTFANIVCPVDFSEVSARGLTTAIHLARAFRSKLQVLTVVTPLSPYHGLDPYWAERTSSEQPAKTSCLREFDDFLSSFDFQDVAWEKHVLSGDPAREIAQRARTTLADLIVMGSVGRTGLPYVFMGSTAVKVARQLPCALLTVKRMHVLTPDIAKKIADINVAFEEGQALLAQGFCQEAIARFDECLAIDARCTDAIEAKAEGFDRLRRQDQADECRKLAETIRQELSEQRVTASVRAQHPLFHRRRPYE